MTVDFYYISANPAIRELCDSLIDTAPSNTPQYERLNTDFVK